jgi:hypothetical protein
MRRPPRGHQDLIHKEVERIFQAMGFSTLDLSALGEGKPDLYVAKGALGCLIEIKSKAGNSKASRPTAKQKAFADLWRGTCKDVRGIGEAEILCRFLDHIWRQTAPLAVAAAEHYAAELKAARVSK